MEHASPKYTIFVCGTLANLYTLNIHFPLTVKLDNGYIVNL